MPLTLCAQLLHDAVQALEALDNKLGEHATLLDTPQPTVVDALLYAYVSIIT